MFKGPSLAETRHRAPAEEIGQEPRRGFAI